MTRVFFYGLFMDVDLLTGKGFHPRVAGPAVLQDFDIVIGEKATLVEKPGAAAYGLNIDLPANEVSALYAGPGVSEYRSTTVDTVMLADRSMQRVACYNLPAARIETGANPQYAEALAALVTRLGFPSDYAQHIAHSATDR